MGKQQDANYTETNKMPLYIYIRKYSNGKSNVMHGYSKANTMQFMSRKPTHYGYQETNKMHFWETNKMQLRKPTQCTYEKPTKCSYEKLTKCNYEKPTKCSYEKTNIKQPPRKKKHWRCKEPTKVHYEKQLLLWESNTMQLLYNKPPHMGSLTQFDQC